MPMRDRQAMRNYQREWRAARRARYASGQSCARCGSTERLEIDHIDPLLKVSNAIWSWSIPRLEEELAKCQWLCNSCHKAKTRTDGTHDRIRGERNGFAVLTNEIVRQIRDSSESLMCLARRFGIGKNTVKCVRARISWKHLP